METIEKKPPLQKKSRGRPPQSPQGGMAVTVYLPKELAALLAKLGRSRWVREKLEEELRKRTSD